MSVNLTGVIDQDYEAILFPISELITVKQVNNSISSISYQLTGYDTLNNYLELLKSAAYLNNLDEPTVGKRIVSVQAVNIEEGMPEMYSNNAHTIIDLINVNDNPPIFSIDEYIGEFFRTKFIWSCTTPSQSKRVDNIIYF